LSRLTFSLVSIIILLIASIIYILFKYNIPIIQPPLTTKVIHIEQMNIPPSTDVESPDKILSNLKTTIEARTPSATEEANQILEDLKEKVKEETPVKQIHLIKQPIIKKKNMVKKELKEIKKSVIKKDIPIKSTPTTSLKKIIKKEGKWETISVSKPFTLEEKPEVKSPIISNETINKDLPIDKLKPVKTLGVVHVSKPFIANE